MKFSVLVTGGRRYFRIMRVFAELDRLHEKHGITLIIQGGANGADRMARGWAEARSVPLKTVYAYWNRYGNDAGPIRNQEMVDLEPDIVLAFPGDAGTRDCVRKAKRAKLTVIQVA